MNFCSSEFNFSKENEQINQYFRKLNVKEYLSPIGAKDYLIKINLKI